MTTAQLIRSAWSPSSVAARAGPIAAASIVVIGVALLVVGYAPATWALRLGDSDNFMRLAEVRDWLAGQSWWDIRQYRADPPGGLYTHWSRLADLPLAAGIVALRLFTDADNAERLALIVVPLLLLIPVLLLQRIIAVGLAGRVAGLPTLLVGAPAAGMLVQFVPGRVDHHGLQILLVVAALAALVRVGGARGGALAAVATAVSLNVGLETAPYLVAMAGFVALDWAWRGDGAVARGYGLGLAVAVPLLFALTVPAADWGLAKNDAIGRAHVVAAIVGGGGLAVLTLLPAVMRGRLVGLAALAVGLGAGIVALFPEAVVAPYAVAGPLVGRLYMANILEMQSIVDDAAADPLVALGRIWFVAAAAIVAVVAVSRVEPRARRWAVLVALLAIVGLALGCWQVRSLALATAIAVPPAGAALGRLWIGRSPVAALTRFLPAYLLLSHTPGSLLTSLAARRAPMAVAAPCNTPAALAALARLPRGVVLAPIDMGGSIVGLTPHAVVAVGIHRDAHGNDLAYRVFTTPPTVAARLMTGVTYVGWCATAGETTNIATAAPHGLLADLRRGAVPPWLTAVPGDGPVRLYRVAAASER